MQLEISWLRDSEMRAASIDFAPCTHPRRLFLQIASLNNIFECEFIFELKLLNEIYRVLSENRT